MKILNVVQGSPEWQTARRTYLCASDAPIMMGASKHTKRSELVRMKATGDQKEFSEWVQKNLLENGHAAEAAARPIIEAMLGEELYPVTGTDEDGRLLASFDGLTMAGDTGFEHKLWNEELAAAVRTGDLPPMYYWQLEHQILVGGLKRIIFACSNGTPEKLVHMEYRPVKGRAEELLASWKQFEEDVAAYQHVEVLPPPSGREIKNLPVLSIQLKGKVTASNLAEYRDTALAFIRAINTDLKTDQDFADAAKTVTFCGETEEKIEAAKEQALAQTKSIAEIFETLDLLKAEMRGKRLELEKLVEARKKTIRADILNGGQAALAQHISLLNQRLGMVCMPAVPADFAGAMKGKKTIVSLRDAVDTELARAKIAANAIADRIAINLNTLTAIGNDHRFLFADLTQIMAKEPEDFTALVKLRIAEHKAKEEQRLEAERARIRAEEVARAQHPAVTYAPAPLAAPGPGNTVVPLRPATRPGDDKIIAVLCQHFNVPPDTVLAWLRDMDLTPTAQAGLATNKGA